MRTETIYQGAMNRHRVPSRPLVPRSRLRPRRMCLGLATAFALFALGTPAASQAQELGVTEASALLESDNADEVRMAIEAMGLVKGNRGVAPLVARIEAGLPTNLLVAALMTLAQAGQPAARPAIEANARHRDPEVRVAALAAAAACKIAGVGAMLRRGLDDLDPRVRAEAARGLGSLGPGQKERDTSAQALLQAIAREEAGAAVALALIANQEHAADLLGLLGQVPLPRLEGALATLLQRRDMALPVKAQVVEALAKTATPHAKAFLLSQRDLLKAQRGVPKNLIDDIEAAAARIAE